MTLYDILATHAPRASSYLEVGTYAGGSLGAVIQANRRIDALCCDNWHKPREDGQPGGPGPVRELARSLGHRGTLRFLEGDSAQVLVSLAETFDLTLVDGNHREMAALADLRLVWPRTRSVMLVHDAERPSVQLAMQAFMAEQAPGSLDFESGLGRRATAIFRRRVS